MIGYKTGYGINLGNLNISGYRKIMGIVFKFGYGYISGRKNKAG